MIVVAYTLFALNLIFFAVLLRYENAGRSVVATPLFLYGFFFLLSTGGAPFALYHSGYSGDVYAIFVVQMAFLAVLIGFLVFLRRRNLSVEFARAVAPETHARGYFVAGVVGSSVFLLGLSLYYYQGLPPLVMVLGDMAKGIVPESDVDSLLKEKRFELTKSHYFGGKYRGQGIVGEVLKVGWRYLLCVALVLHARSRHVGWLLGGVLLFVLTLVFLAGAGVRWNVILVFVTLFVAMTYMRPMKLRTLVGLGAGSVAVFVVVSISIGKGFSQENLVKRALLGDGIHNVQIIELVRDGTLNHRYGRVQGQKYVNAIPGVRHGEPFSTELTRHVSSASRGTLSSPTFVGVVYIDFGLAGILAIFFGVGAFLALLGQWLCSRRNDVVWMTLVVSTISFMPGLALSGFTGFFPTACVLVAFHALFRACAGLAMLSALVASPREVAAPTQPSPQ